MEDLVQRLNQALSPRGRPPSARGSARAHRKLEAFRARMPAGLHPAALELVASIAGSAPVQAESLLEWLPDLVRILPAEVAQEGLGHAARISRASVTASYGFLSHLIHVSGTLGGADLGPWVDEGLRLLERNPSAGRAYFDLHSRSAREGLKRGDRAAHLDDLRESLRLYVQGISGRRLEVQSAGEALAGFPDGRPWPLPYSDGRGVYLPPAVQAFASYQENRLFYRILAAHQAGYHESDTFGFALFPYLERLAGHPVLSRWRPELRRREGPDDFLSDLQVFFHLFPRPGLAQRIFVLVEDGRVDAHLRHRYPGLASDMRPFVEDILARRPGLDRLPFGAALLEMLLRISLDPVPGGPGPAPAASVPVSLRLIWRLLSGRLERAFAAGATVQDAAVAATEVYWMFQGILTEGIASQAARPWAGGGEVGTASDPDPEYLLADALADAAAFSDALLAGLEDGPDETDSLPDLDAQLEFRGATDLGQVQKGLRMAEQMENASADDPGSGRQVMSLDELRRLLEMGVEITVESVRDEAFQGPGLYYQNPSQAFPLLPSLKKNRGDDRALKAEMASLLRREHRRQAREADATIHYYDEWDHTIQDYRTAWCRLLEREVRREGNGFAATVKAAHGPLIPAVRRQFEKIRPEEYRKQKSLLEGEEIDLERAVEHVIDRRCGLPGTNRLYQQRRRVQRDVCTVFLVDMSSSTSEPVCVPVAGAGPGAPGAGADMGVGVGPGAGIVARGGIPVNAAPGMGATASGGPAPGSSRSSGRAAPGPDIADDLARIFPGPRTSLGSDALQAAGGGSTMPNAGKRIIDVEKEALILLAEALDVLGDRYGIFGFSGCGRMQVDFYTIKDFAQRYTGQVRERIGAIEPKGSTRMGTALRHCRARLNREDARRKNLFLISDGFPQDQDYGYDRSSHEYGVEDTARALAELEQDGTYTYCITVDRRGEDYLRRMCPESKYMVIHDIPALPEALLKLYRKVTT